jgi:Bacterial conjugation TrbI-like protein
VNGALDDQTDIEKRLKAIRATTHQSSATHPTDRSTPRSQPTSPNRTAPQPRTVAVSPSPRIQTAPTPVSRSAPVSLSTPSSSRPVDPMEQWQELAKLGSYGSIQPEAPPQRTEFSDSEQATQRVRQAIQNAPYSVASSSNSPEPEPPPILEEAEAPILESDSVRHSLTVGTTGSGELLTPLAIAESNNADRFTVKLTEPLMDNQGQIAFPDNTELVVQVDSVSETGQVHSSAIAATWSIHGQQKELTLPPGAIQVRGEGGEPLMAEHFEDRGGAIAGMDAGQFLLGAAGRAAQLYTRSGSRVQTSGSSTIVSEDNPAPNIIAGLVEGGTDAVLDSIQQRNQRAIERMETTPNIRFVEAGTPVEIFVNQSMFMPM